MTPAKLAKLRHDCINQALALRDALAKAELWKTYQRCNSVIQAIGWEAAEIAERELKPKKKRKA